MGKKETQIIWTKDMEQTKHFSTKERGIIDTSIIPTASEENFLDHLAVYHYLTVEQLMRFKPYSKNTLSDVQKKLHRLKKGGYVERIHREITDGTGRGHGSLPMLYRLDARGISYLTKRDSEIGNLPKRRHILKLSQYGYDHTMAVNDFLISLFCLTRDYKDTFRIDEQIHELEMRTHFTGSGIERIADGFIKNFVTSTHGRYYQPIILELERTTAQDKHGWIQKVRHYTAMTEQRVKDYFQVKTLQYAVVALNEHDRDNLVTWTEDELKHSHTEHFEDVFMFTAWDNALSPLEQICGNRWKKANSKGYYPLYEDVKIQS